MLGPLPRVRLLQKPTHLLQHKGLRLSISRLCPVQQKCMTMAQGSCLALPASGFTRMGWADPIARWGRLTEDELHACALPLINMQEYSRSRREWHQRWVSLSTLRAWLLALEEHSFYLLAIKSLSTVSIKTPSKFTSGDREFLVVMAQVCDGDLSDELGHVRSFHYPDHMSLYVAAVMDQVRSILRLRVPLPVGFTFHRAPIWTFMPEDGLDPSIFRM